MAAPYTSPARVRPLPPIPSDYAASSFSSPTILAPEPHCQLKRTRALVRGHGYSRSADHGRLTRSRPASPAPASIAPDPAAAVNPRPPRHAQRRRSYSFDSSGLSPGPQSASDIVSWYANMPPEGAEERPLFSSDPDFDDEPSSTLSPSSPRRPFLSSPSTPFFSAPISNPLPVTDLKSATLAFVSARKAHPTRVDPNPDAVPVSLGAALFGYKPKPVLPLQPRSRSASPAPSVDSTPTSPRVLPSALPPIVRPTVEREYSFMSDISDSSGDGNESDDLFDEVAEMLKARIQSLEVQEKGSQRNVEESVPQ